MKRRRVAGLHAVEAALSANPDRIVSAWVDDRRSKDPGLTILVRKLAEIGVRAQYAARLRLDGLAEGHPHQGIVVEMLTPPELGEHELSERLTQAGPSALFLVLDQVQDPHNFGACLRTADAAGIHGVVVTRDRAAALTPTVAKVASGAAETIPIYRVTNLSRTLDDMKEAGLWIAGAAGEGETSLFSADLTTPLAVVVGGEGKGLRRLTRERCDLLVRIPMCGRVESLNVSVATGILLFEAVRQRSATGPAQRSASSVPTSPGIGLAT